jgi:hypothetical protein
MWKFRLDGPGDGRVLLLAAILAKMRRRKKMIKMKRNLARALSIWKSWMNPPKTEDKTANDVCPSCGARVYTPRTTTKDIAVTILCSILLLAIAIPAAWATEQWIDRES